MGARDYGLSGPVNGNGNCGNGGVQDQDTADQVTQPSANSGNNFTKDIEGKGEKSLSPSVENRLGGVLDAVEAPARVATCVANLEK